MAALAATSEVTGGLLTAAGLADPLGPVVIAGTMAVAANVHRDKGPLAAKGGFELPLTNLAAAAALATIGPGRFSLDRLLGSRLSPRLAHLTAAGTTMAAVAVIARATLRTRHDPAAATPTAPALEQCEPSAPLHGGSALRREVN
jgi:putative oxidoreductase